MDKDFRKINGGNNNDYRLERIGETLVVKLSGELDHHLSAELRDALDREINIHDIKNIIFDFGDVNFMDSSGIGMIMGRYKLIKAKGGKVMVIRPQKQVDRILEMSGIKKILECG